MYRLQEFSGRINEELATTMTYHALEEQHLEAIGRVRVSKSSCLHIQVQLCNERLGQSAVLLKDVHRAE